jgi:hypothetical protein
MHAVCYENQPAGRLTICLANTWGWFQSTQAPNPQLNEGTPPDPCADVAIELALPGRAVNRAFEALTATELALAPTADGVRVRVPQFQINACVVAELR